MSVKVDDLVLRIEAVLFASGKPLSIGELTEALGVNDFHLVQQAMKTLIRTYDGRQTALEVRRVGDRFALKVKEPFVAAAEPITPVEIPPRTLKALTLIAYHQPIRQSVLARMMGEATYEEVQRLRDLGFVHADPKGATLELRTTHRFVEYFGIASARPEEIRTFLEHKLGVVPSTAPVAVSGDSTSEPASVAVSGDSTSEPASEEGAARSASASGIAGSPTT
jgi:segregation and condensation protein B